MKILLVILAVFLSASSMANSWVNDTKIVDVRWYGDYGYITTASPDDPENCGNSANANRYFTNQTPGYKEFMSMSLTAMTAGKTVNILLDDCFGDHNVLKGLVVKAN